MSASTRRAVLAGTSASLAAVALGASPAAATAVSPDASLLAACVQFHKADATRIAEDNQPDLSDERGEELDDAWDNAFDAVAAMQPITPQGLKAQAAVASRGMRWKVDVNRAETWQEQAERHERLAIDCLNRVSGVAIVPAAVASTGDQDAAVQQAAAEVLRLETEPARRENSPDADRDILHAHQSEAMRCLAALPALSLAGLRAKGTVLAVYCEGNPLEDGTPCGDVIASLLADLTSDGRMPAPRPINPDAELIAACVQHVANMDALNASNEIDQNAATGTDGPLTLAYERTKGIISAAEPQTLTGILAKVRVAKYEALNLDGEEDWGCSMGEVWAPQIANDLLRVVGGASIGGAA